MSDISYDTGINILIYKINLQKNIDNVLKKIGMSDKGIKWIIFDEKKYLNNKRNDWVTIPSFLHEKDYKYGFCDLNKNEIWISTAAIMKAPIDYFDTYKILFGREKENFLVNVILDELAHVSTQRNHGNETYEKQLYKFHQRYYDRVGISIL